MYNISYGCVIKYNRWARYNMYNNIYIYDILECRGHYLTLSKQ